MVELPSGTVSMLFSDVEHSTLLLNRLGPAFVQALDGFQLEQRRAWTDCGGVEISTEGDSFFVVFWTAEDAVRAAVQAQRGLAAREWPQGEQVRVRMGIHTGTPTSHKDNYLGVDVHRAARIAATAHGGQVVLSDATAQLVGDKMPDGITLRDLGHHRLKDLPAPEHVFQLVIPDLLADFPPLKSLGTTSSLPVTTTTLVGRETEVAEVAALLVDPDVRLVTLTGPGGAGKTRLAVAAAGQVSDRFPDGVWFVPLASLTSADVVWSSIGEVLDLPATDRNPPTFFKRVENLNGLFVLDNLEQLNGADEAVDTLLREAPRAAVLATSRRPLNLTSEHQRVVPPLDVPAQDTAAAVAESPAVRLFVERAQAVRAGFALTDDNAADVAAICRRLDGLPLAIELAAARVKLLKPAALLARLGDALDLRGSGADRPARQQALRDTIQWSYSLLGAEQRTLFCRLGVFAGSASLDGLEAVTADPELGGADPLDLVAELVDASLVTTAENPHDDEPRFTMLETVRAFALEALAAGGELDDVRRRHALHCVEVAGRLEVPEVLTSRESLVRGGHLFDLERSNFREALTWATVAGPDGEERHAAALALLARVSWMWNHMDLAESCHWLEVCTYSTEGERTADLGRTLTGYALALTFQGEFDRARETAERSVAILEAVGDPYLAEALFALADLETGLGDPQAGRATSERALRLVRDAGDLFTPWNGLTSLAGAEMGEGRWDRAVELLQEVADLADQEGADYVAANARRNIAIVLRKLGRAAEAHAVMSAQLREWMRVESELNLVWSAEDYGAVLAEAGFPRLAPYLLGAADAARARFGVARDEAQDEEIRDAYSAAREAMTPGEWDVEYERGKRVKVTDAIVEAIEATS